MEQGAIVDFRLQLVELSITNKCNFANAVQFFLGSVVLPSEYFSKR